MYELIILAHLMRKPSHGYLIAKIINNIIGPYARMSNGRLYPLMAKLEAAGLITIYTNSEAEPQNERHLRSYTITEAGQRRFHEIMMDTTINPGEYQKIFAQKMCNADLLKPNERLRLIDHYMNYCQAHIQHQEIKAEDIVQLSPDWGPECSEACTNSILRVLQHAIEQWQGELAWARGLRIREMEQAQNDSSAKKPTPSKHHR